MGVIDKAAPDVQAQAHATLGSAVVRPTEAEQSMRKIARRSVAAVRDIARGVAFTSENVALARPGTGMPPEMIGLVLGRSASRDIRAGEILSFVDIA